MCSLDEGREDKVNLNCSENDQQWRGGVGCVCVCVCGGGGGCVRKHGEHRAEDRVTRGMQGRGAGEGEE